MVYSKVSFVPLIAALFTCSSYAATVITTVNLTNNSKNIAYYADDGSHQGPPVPSQQVRTQFTESKSTNDQCWMGQTSHATYKININKFNELDKSMSSICLVTLKIVFCDDFGSLAVKSNSHLDVANASSTGDGCTAVWQHRNNYPVSLDITVSTR